MKFINYLKKEGKRFVDSFRCLDQSILYIVLCDLVLSAAVFAGAISIREFMTRRGQTLLGVDLTLALSQQTTAMMQKNAALMQAYYRSVVEHIILVAVVLLIVYIVSRMIVWSAISKRKADKKFAKRFILLSLPWTLAWIFAIFVIVSVAKPDTSGIVGVVMILIYSHITAVLYTSFTKKLDGKKAFRKSFDVGLTKIHYFLIPYVFAAAVFYVLNVALNVLKISPMKGEFMFAGTIVMLFYIAWLRLYIYSTAEELV